MTSDAHREDAVEHVYTFFDCFLKLMADTDAHEIPWKFFGEEGADRIEDAVHFLFRFTNGEASDCVSIKSNGDEFFRALFTQISF